jgi:hypothetical protein
VAGQHVEVADPDPAWADRFAEQHRDNRNACTNAKEVFIRRTLHQAGISPPLRGPLPE